MRSATGAPLWSPTPLQVTAARIVCSCVNGGLCKSFVVYQLTGISHLSSVAKQPHFVACRAGLGSKLFRRLEMGGVSRRERGGSLTELPTSDIG
jgi:hypothetical protein